MWLQKCDIFILYCAEKQQQSMVIELSDWHASLRKKLNPKDPFCHRKTVLHDIKCLVHQMSFSRKTQADRHCSLLKPYIKKIIVKEWHWKGSLLRFELNDFVVSKPCKDSHWMGTSSHIVSNGFQKSKPIIGHKNTIVLIVSSWLIWEGRKQQGMAS